RLAAPVGAASAHGPAPAVAGGSTTPGAWSVLFADLGLEWSAVWWAPILLAPAALLAPSAPATRKTWLGVGALVLAAAGSITAVVDLGARLSVSDGVRVAVWPGTALSVAWLGLIVACGLAVDGVRRRPPLL